MSETARIVFFYLCAAALLAFGVYYHSALILCGAVAYAVVGWVDGETQRRDS